MPIRQIKIDYTAPLPEVPIMAGYMGEHNATELLIVPPAELTGDEVKSYTAAFETGGKVYHSRSFEPGEAIKIPLWQQLTAERLLCVQLEAYDGDGELVAKSPMVYLALLPAARGAETETDYGSNGIAAEIAENTKLRHEHDNKTVLDKLGSDSDSLTYDGQSVNGKVYIGEEEPTDENAEVWINPHAKVGAGYPLVKTVTVMSPSEGVATYVDTFGAFLVYIKNTATTKLIPPNAKIIGIDFVIAGTHYFNTEIKKMASRVFSKPFVFEFFPRHNSTPINDSQTIAQIADQEASQISAEISKAGGVTEFTVYYFEAVGNMAVVKVKDSSGNWVYTTTASGEKGDTPIRGVDYWTASDKTEIVNSVLQSLPKWTGGDF